MASQAGADFIKSTRNRENNSGFSVKRASENKTSATIAKAPSSSFWKASEGVASSNYSWSKKIRDIDTSRASIKRWYRPALIGS
jgi:hypothetical protein